MTFASRFATISCGEVSERFKVLLSKSSVVSKPPRVRIPPSPPEDLRHLNEHGRVA